MTAFPLEMRYDEQLSRRPIFASITIVHVLASDGRIWQSFARRTTAHDLLQVFHESRPAHARAPAYDRQRNEPDARELLPYDTRRCRLFQLVASPRYDTIRHDVLLMIIEHCARRGILYNQTCQQSTHFQRIGCVN